MRQGFTLLELSVVLALLGVILGGGLVVLTASVQTSQYNATIDRMNVLDAALLNYRVAFNRLPCPANLKRIPSDANYGVEAATPGSCTGGTLAANSSGNNGGDTVAEGAVPTRALRLPDNYMYDGWGRRFRYAVDVTMTAANAFVTTSILPASCTAGGISVTDASDVPGNRTTLGVYALVSHGANGHGGYTANGVPVNAGSVNTDEQTNCHCGPDGTNATYSGGAYTPTYVQKLPATVNTANALNNFDDIVSYKTLAQMQTLATSEPLGQCFGLYIADNGNDTVRLVSASGTINLVAGVPNQSGFPATLPATATGTYLSNPYGVAADNLGNIYVADTNDAQVLKVTSSGTIAAFAGIQQSAGYSGDGLAATAAQLNSPSGVAVDSSNNVYIADTGNHCIRKVTAATGIITTVADNYPNSGWTGDGGAATSAYLSSPWGLALDSAGNIFVSDTGNSTVRKITAATNIITTVAGTGVYGSGPYPGTATSTPLANPYGVAVDGAENVYIANRDTQQILKVSSGIVSAYAGTYQSNGFSGDNQTATSAQLSEPDGVAVDSANNIYISDSGNHRIRKVTAATGYISTVAGNGGQNESGDGQAATSATLNSPAGLYVPGNR